MGGFLFFFDEAAINIAIPIRFIKNTNSIKPPPPLLPGASDTGRVMAVSAAGLSFGGVYKPTASAWDCL
ncbi:hypothetical protein D3C86_1769760 [compost metagenome]